MFALIKLFFLFIFIAIFIGLFFILALVGNVISFFRKAPKHKQDTNAYQSTSSTTQPQRGPERKKIIPKDEGEYVDFEEV